MLTWPHIYILIRCIGYIFQHHKHIGHRQPLKYIIYGRLGHFLSGQDHYVQDVCYCPENANLGDLKKQERINIKCVLCQIETVSAHILSTECTPLGHQSG